MANAIAAYGLSPMQQGMLFHSLDPRDRGVDVEQVLCTLTEPLNVSRFVDAWQRVIARHDILRTSFEWEGQSEPLQNVYDSVTMPVQVLDWRHFTREAQAEAVRTLLDEDRNRGFDLRRAPLMRLTIAACGDKSVEVLWSFHHAILDGRSFPILLREVFAVYDAAERGQRAALTPARQFGTYVEWLQSQDLDAAKSFWTTHLAGFSSPTALFDAVTPGTGEGMGSVERRLTSGESAKLHAFARTSGLSVGTLVTGAWSLLLHRYTGDTDVVFGTTRAGRHATVTGADEMVGLLINTVPFRARVSPDSTIADWLAGIRANQLATRTYEQTPLPRIQSWSEVDRGTPLFETLLVFESYLLDTVLHSQGGSWTNRHFAYTGRTNYPLTFLCYDDAEVLLRLEYNRQRIDDPTAARMLDHLGRLLIGLTDDRARRVADVPMLSADERAALLPVASAAAAIQTFCLHERFERTVAELPDATALTHEGQSWTYDQVNRRANQLAHRLRKEGVGPDVLVGIYMERSPDIVIAMLAILKAGGAYLPLDPAYPGDRLKFILADARVRIIVTARECLADVPASDGEVICVGDHDDYPTENLPPVARPDHLAYVIYTSGSTGRPKGVLITHANVSRLFDASDAWFQFDRNDVWTLFHSYAFDLSVWEMWGAFLYGGRLVVVPYWVSRSPDAFVELLEREQVTSLTQTPSAFRQVMDAEGALPQRARLALRYVVLAGEALEISSLRGWFARHGDEQPKIINMYGITETTVHVTYRHITIADVEAGAGSMIGVPIPDLEVYVLDAQQQLVPVGVTGEMYVAGPGVARGYLERPELTERRFIVDPVGGSGVRLYRSGDLGRWVASGELEYRGRMDDQVKIRGFRVELGEIEAVVRMFAGVRDAAILAVAERGGDKRLVGYLVLDPGVSLDELRAFMRVRLPDYMVPGAFVTLDALPLTTNGKIDRRALPAPSAALVTAPYMAPRTEVERTLAEVWAAVLRRDAVGVEDNFFELGGDSILSIQVIARSRQRGLQLTTRDIFKYPTIAALAAFVVPAAATARRVESSTGAAPLTPIARWFFDQPLAERNHWNQTFLFEVAAGTESPDLESALHAVLKHHDAFRLRFRESSGEWVSEYVDAVPPVPLERIDIRNMSDDQVRSLVASKGITAQRSLDIGCGPIAAVIHFDAGTARAGRLLFAVHHLVVDAVSWGVILDDLESAYTSVRNKVPLQLVEPTTTFKAWAERLGTYAQDGAGEGLAAWLRTIDGPRGSLPRDRAADPAMNTEGSAASITVELSAADTTALLQRAPAAYGTQINDLLLAALAKTILPWAGSESLLVDVEGHGREDLFDDLSASRSVGWFTTVFPVRLEGPTDAPGVLIGRTKEALRQLHHRGLSFGALKYLSTDPSVARALAATAPSELLFNYLGQLDTLTSGSGLFRFAAESCGPSRAAANRRSHLLDVLAFVADGRLNIQWTYCTHVHDPATIEAIACGYAAAIRELVEHCVSARVVRRTPADFQLAALAQPEIDDLTRRFPALVDVYPMAPMQQLFFSVDASQASPGFEQWEFLLEGPLEPMRLRHAWQQIAARHPILRTAFVQTAGIAPCQVVVDAVTVPWIEEDWRAFPADQQERMLATFRDADRVSPFDLTQPPLMRLALLRTSDRAYRLIWSTHHLLVDGWSWPLIFAELSALYQGGTTAALGKPCAYRDYVQWLQERDGRDDERFWRAKLSGFVDPTPIPLMPADFHDGSEVSGEAIRLLPTDVTDAIAAVARTHHVTLTTIVGAAWTLVLAHHSGRADVSFGASFAGRPEQVPGIETMVGPCVNNLPIRVRVDDRQPTGEWLRRLHEQIGELTAYQTTPLAQIHACSEVPPWTRLFDSLLVVQNYVVDSSVEALGDVTLRPVHTPSTTSYPATIVVRPGRQLEIKVLRSGSRFRQASAIVAADDLVTILVNLAANQAETVGALLARLPVESRGLAGAAAAERSSRRARTLPPRTEMEGALVGIWRELFGGDIGTDENYFELGVHSLALMRAHERICATMKPDLPIAALFQYPTVRDLAAYLTSSATSRGRQLDIPSRAAQQQQAAARRRALARPGGRQ